MDMTEIQNTIEELEHGATTFDACLKLASLYIIVDKMSPNNMVKTIVEQELKDILPAYRKYVNVKRQYQLGEISEDMALKSFAGVCKELAEFVQTLYSTSDFPQERSVLADTVSQLMNIFE